MVQLKSIRNLGLKSKIYTGINIQWPISEEITSGRKTIETRTYAIPEKYLNQEMLLIETPGKIGKFKARGVAIIKFTGCIEYKNKKHFYADLNKHLVDKKSEWAWTDKVKFGWQVELVKKLSPPIDLSSLRKGIVFTKDINLSSI